MKNLTDEMVKRVLKDSAEAVRQARRVERQSKEKYCEAIAELIRRGYMVNTTF